MPKKSNESLPPDVVSHWPEVFEDLDVQVVPIEYLHSIRVYFQDGKVWDIDIEKSRAKDGVETLEETLEALFVEYDEHIVNVDFRLDTIRLKEDITKRTKYFLKKRK